MITLIRSTTLAFAVAAVNGVRVAAQAPASVNSTVRSTEQLAAGVYVIRHPDAPNGFPQSNATVIIGDSAVLVVDSEYLPSLDPVMLVPGHGEPLRGTEFLDQVTSFVDLVVGHVQRESPRIGRSLANADAMQKVVEGKIDLAMWRRRFGGDVPENARFFDSFSWPGLIQAAFAEAWGR